MLILHYVLTLRHCENRVAIRGNPNETLGQRMDCHDFGILTIPNARNDGSACVSFVDNESICIASSCVFVVSSC